MARIAGINLPNNKHIWIALTSIYGIGDTRARHICNKVGIEATKKVKDLEEKDLESIRQFIDEYQLEGDLRRENSNKHQTSYGCWIIQRNKTQERSSTARAEDKE